MATRTAARRVARQFRHGSEPNWKIVRDAVISFDRPVSTPEVSARIRETYPEFALRGVAPNLSVLSVNCNSRGHHAVNERPRQAGSGNQYDSLFRVGRGLGTRFRAYDPRIDGVWELVDVGDEVLRPRLSRTADQVELDDERFAVRRPPNIDPALDARRRIIASIVQREGQPAFRQALLDAYEGKCAISDCDVEALLEAAHIVPYRGAHTNLVENGLLLRADLHKLFDLHLFRIDPVNRVVHLSEALAGSEYAGYEGVVLRAPKDATHAPLAESLKYHEERCVWMNVSSDGSPLE